MAIGPVVIQGQITRTQDFTAIKHNEDTRGMVEQAYASTQFAKKVEEQTTKVNRREKSEYQDKKFDAKDKGSNEYRGDGGKRRKNAAREADGKVLIKGVGSFDVSG